MRVDVRSSLSWKRSQKRISVCPVSQGIVFGITKKNVFDRFRLILGQNRDKSFHFVLLAQWIISFHVIATSFLCKNSCKIIATAAKTLRFIRLYRFIRNALLFLSKPNTALPPVYGTLTIRTAFFPWTFGKSRFSLRHSEHSNKTHIH